MDIIQAFSDNWFWIVLVCLFVWWADKNAKEKQSIKKEQDHIQKEEAMNQATGNEDTMKAKPDTVQTAVSKSIYEKMLTVPVWAMYFLIVSTVILTVLILGKVWFPEAFDDDFFWKVIFSYLALMISTVVIAKMSEAIKFIKEQEQK